MLECSAAIELTATPISNPILHSPEMMLCVTHEASATHPYLELWRAVETSIPETGHEWTLYRKIAVWEDHEPSVYYKYSPLYWDVALVQQHNAAIMCCRHTYDRDPRELLEFDAALDQSNPTAIEFGSFRAVVQPNALAIANWFVCAAFQKLEGAEAGGNQVQPRFAMLR